MLMNISSAISLLDIHMPNLTGLQILKELKKQKINVKSIFLTVYADEDIFDEAMDKGSKRLCTEGQCDK